MVETKAIKHKKLSMVKLGLLKIKSLQKQVIHKLDGIQKPMAVEPHTR